MNGTKKANLSKKKFLCFAKNTSGEEYDMTVDIKPWKARRY